MDREIHSEREESKSPCIRACEALRPRMKPTHEFMRDQLSCVNWATLVIQFPI